ncbi:globin-like protein, partial [Basidiobolus meristosporus CBS 931.73]
MKPSAPPTFDEASLTPVVATFYQYNLADDRINRFFKRIDIKALKYMQTRFLTYALNGSGINKKIMSMNHRHLGLQDHHFDAVLENLKKALLDHGVDETQVNPILAAAESTRDSMLGRPSHKTNDD